MKKPLELHRYLIENISYLKNNPEKFNLSVDDGKIFLQASDSLNHHYAYHLNLNFLACQIELKDIVLPLIRWLKINQDDIFHNPVQLEKGLQFSVSYTTKIGPDYNIKIELSELHKTQKNGSQTVHSYSEELRLTPPYNHEYWAEQTKKNLRREWHQPPA